MAKSVNFKRLLVLTFLFLALPFIGKSQLSDENDINASVKEIILNFQSRGINHFNIEKSLSNEFMTEPRLTTFKYQFLNDSIFSHKHGKRISNYVLRKSKIIQLDSIEDSVWFDLNRNSYHTLEDSAGIEIRKSQIIISGDTTLSMYKSVAKDSIDNSITILIKYRVDSLWTINKQVTTNISDDIVRVQSYSFSENTWLLNSDFVTFKLHSETESTSTTTELTYGNDFKLNKESDFLNLEGTLERKTVTHFNQREMIEKIVITNKSKAYQLFGNSTTVLTPIRLK